MIDAQLSQDVNRGLFVNPEAGPTETDSGGTGPARDHTEPAVLAFPHLPDVCYPRPGNQQERGRVALATGLESFDLFRQRQGEFLSTGERVNPLRYRFRLGAELLDYR